MIFSMNVAAVTGWSDDAAILNTSAVRSGTTMKIENLIRKAWSEILLAVLLLAAGGSFPSPALAGDALNSATALVPSADVPAFPEPAAAGVFSGPLKAARALNAPPSDWERGRPVPAWTASRSGQGANRKERIDRKERKAPDRSEQERTERTEQEGRQSLFLPFRLRRVRRFGTFRQRFSRHRDNSRPVPPPGQGATRSRR